VLDGGKPQEIAFFSATAPGHAPAHPLPASVFTNRSDLKGEDPGATIVLLFDCLNTSFEDQGYARWNVLHFLKSVKPPPRCDFCAYDRTHFPARLHARHCRARQFGEPLQSPTAGSL
jgi:hypothetical protein